MADNRMAIICKECNLGVAIAKFYHFGGWSRHSGNERINKFFFRHAHCVKAYDDPNYNHQYRLGYEDEDDWEYEPPEEE